MACLPSCYRTPTNGNVPSRRGSVDNVTLVASAASARLRSALTSSRGSKVELTQQQKFSNNNNKQHPLSRPNQPWPDSEALEELRETFNYLPVTGRSIGRLARDLVTNCRQLLGKNLTFSFNFTLLLHPASLV